MILHCCIRILGILLLQHLSFSTSRHLHSSPYIYGATFFNSSTLKDQQNLISIAYVYTFTEANCQQFPPYLKHSLKQAIRSQPDSLVFFLSNFNDCNLTYSHLKDIPSLQLINTNEILSKKTQNYQLLSSKGLFNHSGTAITSPLWMTSALRFFQLEDFMITYGFSELFHIEGDNLLYRNLSSLLPIFRKGYPRLATTPLLANKSMFTASVFWIGDINYLKEFNDYLLTLAKHFEISSSTSSSSSFPYSAQEKKAIDKLWQNYSGFLRKHFCCKKNGIDSDKQGNGIKPFALNEMTMLAFYHLEKKESLQLLPIIPTLTTPYPIKKPYCNPNDYQNGGLEVSLETSQFQGIFDSGSWGQYFGGTWVKRGRDTGFIDDSHIIGQSILLLNRQCEVNMLCTDGEKFHELSNETLTIIHQTHSEEAEHFPHSLHSTCHTAPFVRCEHSNWTPLWNIHIHSKNTGKYMSRPCSCRLLISK